MAQILTRQFGCFEYDPAAAIEFPGGLPGFETQRRFVLIEQPNLAPILFLQSVESPELCFAAAPVNAIEPEYDLALTEEDARLLDVDETSSVLALAILSAPSDGPLSANLLAPVVVNPQSRRAVQAVRMDSRYSHKHPLAQEATCL
jgi:flagellar assembly factor FliW